MIRLACPEDMPALQNIYRAARHYMQTHGNPHQWGNTNPREEILWEDIYKKQLYVIDNNGVHGAFAFIIGEDPTYAYIENGIWRSNTPYGTIHRMASDGTTPGMFAQCAAFCKTKMPHLRVDTHEDNHTMQHLVQKHGFVYCGIIYVHPDSPRLAYEWLKKT